MWTAKIIGALIFESPGHHNGNVHMLQSVFSVSRSVVFKFNLCEHDRKDGNHMMRFWDPL